MLTLAPERYTAEFCMVARVFLWCIRNHCKADSIDLHNARAVNFLWKPSKNMSKYYFSKCHIFLSKKFGIEKYLYYLEAYLVKIACLHIHFYPPTEVV